MMHLSRHPIPRLITILLVVLLPACYSWHAVDGGARRYISEERPGIVRLTLTDGRKIDMVDPEVLGESIVGRVDERSTIADEADVAVAQERRFEAFRTGAAIAVVVGALVGVTVGVFTPSQHLKGCSPLGC